MKCHFYKRLPSFLQICCCYKIEEISIHKCEQAWVSWNLGRRSFGRFHSLSSDYISWLKTIHCSDIWNLYFKRCVQDRHSLAHTHSFIHRKRYRKINMRNERVGKEINSKSNLMHVNSSKSTYNYIWWAVCLVYLHMTSSKKSNPWSEKGRKEKKWNQQRQRHTNRCAPMFAVESMHRYENVTIELCSKISTRYTFECVFV